MSKTGKGPRKSEKHKEAGNEYAKLQHKSTLVSKMGEKTRGAGGAECEIIANCRGLITSKLIKRINENLRKVDVGYGRIKLL